MEENRRLNTTLVQPLPVGEVPGIAAPARLPRPGCIYCSLPGRGAAGAGRRSPPQKCPRPSVCRPTCSPTSRPPGAAGRRGSTRRCASGSGTRTPRDRPARGKEGGWLAGGVRASKRRPYQTGPYRTERLAPQPAIERIRHTQRRCQNRSRPDQPTRGSRTNTGDAVRASRQPRWPRSSY